MSAFVPDRPQGSLPEPPHPTLDQEPRDYAERQARWEVRAAQWRARELAEAVFGAVAVSSLVGLRGKGRLRGLLRLDVPFDDLTSHREREVRFLAAAAADPVLARVNLVYVLGPAVG